MSDRLAVVRTVRWLCVAAIAACGDDPMLHVHVDHPENVEVVRTVVTIYESSAFDCDDIAFSRVGDTELRAARVADQSVTRDGQIEGSLEGISRTDRKLVMARGYSAAETWVTAGCAQQDVVEDT